ncbi:MAG: hypothetical protein KGJ10_02925 [Acidobacteriota bacterium]|nr:hypothetical protein [Acidobacteriota bacterium]MDE3043766.1 hypothetical protein [Acidobacteriota bacterium]MDE3107215.1 hypothetical protein [Acidobacteriota bacterium]
MVNGELSASSSDASREHRGNLRTHLTLLIGLLFCGAAFWFELHRALGGNGLSWAYVFEWPLLAAFAIYMWWKVLHPEKSSNSSPTVVKGNSALAPEFDSMLAGWEAHQRELEASRRDVSNSFPTPTEPTP